MWFCFNRLQPQYVRRYKWNLYTEKIAYKWMVYCSFTPFLYIFHCSLSFHSQFVLYFGNGSICIRNRITFCLSRQQVQKWPCPELTNLHPTFNAGHMNTIVKIVTQHTHTHTHMHTNAWDMQYSCCYWCSCCCCYCHPPSSHPALPRFSSHSFFRFAEPKIKWVNIKM